MRAGSWVATRKVRSPRSSSSCAVEELGALGVERVERLVEEEELWLVQERRQSASRCSIPRENEPARSFRASQSPKRSSSIPMRSRRSGTR